MKQTPLTLRFPVKDGATLDQHLSVLASDPAGNALLPHGRLTQLHFAAWVHDRKRDFLLFEANVDGSVDDFLEKWVDSCEIGLRQILGQSSGTRKELLAFLKECLLPTNAYFIAWWGRSCQQILAELALWKRIRAWLDNQQPISESPGHLYNKIKLFLGVGRLEKLQTFPKTPFLVASKKFLGLMLFLFLLIGFIFVTKAMLVLLVTLLAILLVYAITLRYHEHQEPSGPLILDVDSVRACQANEDKYAQNHFAGITKIKPGRFRLFSLQMLLSITNLILRFLFNQGKLGPIDTVHFARFLILDQKWLVFLSNFGGSWNRYLDDYTDQFADELSAVWSHCIGFPKTWFLFWGGADNAEAFKTFQRNSQVPTSVYYSAYPDLTNERIICHTQIRKGLVTKMDQKEIKTWLHLL